MYYQKLRHISSFQVPTCQRDSQTT